MYFNKTHCNQLMIEKEEISWNGVRMNSTQQYSPLKWLHCQQQAECICEKKCARGIDLTDPLKHLETKLVATNLLKL
jgi:hypothetical protein